MIWRILAQAAATEPYVNPAIRAAVFAAVRVGAYMTSVLLIALIAGLLWREHRRRAGS